MLETNDVMELSDLQKELDDLSVNQEALMEEWSDLSGTVGTLNKHGNLFVFQFVQIFYCCHTSLSI